MPKDSIAVGCLPKGRERVELISKVQEFSFVEGWYELASDSHFWFQWRLTALLGQLARLQIPLTAPLRGLDVGGGTGVFRDQLEAASRWTVDIIDLDLSALVQAKPGRGRIMYYDIREEHDTLVGSYDIVFLFDVLEHIRNTQPFLGSVIRHIKPGGYLFVNVPALQVLYSRYDETVGHVRRYNRETLRSEFRHLSMEVRILCYWGLTLVPVLLLRKCALCVLPRGQETRTVSWGFKPVHPVINTLLRAVMRIETACLGTPPIGSSVLMVGQKVV